MPKSQCQHDITFDGTDAPEHEKAEFSIADNRLRIQITSFGESLSLRLTEEQTIELAAFLKHSPEAKAL